MARRAGGIQPDFNTRGGGNIQRRIGNLKTVLKNATKNLCTLRRI
ncbi:MAG: hypothetical protein ACP5I8_02465 [Phycisphaerae bacterium]